MEKKGKITDFRSADTEGCPSTSAETFKHYEPSPAQHHKKYEVFLSFQGTDVEKNFVDHLFNSLSTAGFRVFAYTEKLEKGKNIEVSREDAIGNSTVIPIFSANYASSPQCLDELSLIWTCKSTSPGTTIIPLFYDVKPSDVRYPNKKEGPYAKAFQEHREKSKHSVKEMDAWMEALYQVSLLSGWSLAETAAGYEGRLVKQVVMDLLKTLDINNLDVPKHLKGLSDPIKEVTTLLEKNDHPVLGVGIWGMGGLGKTTLAKAVYNNIRHKFEASCFVSDVRASSKDSIKGLLKLQKQILRDLAKDDESALKKLNSVPNAKSRMENRFRSIKALVFLDDVDDEEQIDALVGDAVNGYWFGAGTRIIITTRDYEVLKRQTPVNQYPMKELDSKESLELFSWHAFMRTGPAEGYEDVTRKVVDACNGLPLSLEVVGARLYGEKSLEIWSEALKNLVKYHKKVYDTLKISYDGLSGEEKRMFLDIACFFLGPLFFPSTRYNTEFYVKLWEASELSTPRTCLKILEMKSLIRINYDTYHGGYSIFWMHDHIRDLARQIIEESSPSNPAERSRFWRYKDLVTAMTQTQGMPNVEGLVLDFNQAEEGLHQLNCSAYPWPLMPNLKFMFIRDLRQEGRTNLPPNLIFLSLWSSQSQECESASETQPVSFYLPKTIGELKSLRFLDMTGTSIYHLPNEVGELFNLEELYLSHCNLREISQSFANLIKLKVLDISYNPIICFPANFHFPSSLTVLRLEGCKNLEKMPNVSPMKKLEALDLSWCKSLTELPSLDFMHSLRDLRLGGRRGGCEKLQALPALPDTLSHLYVNGCRKLQEVSSISYLKKLEALDLSGCTSLTGLPSLDFMHSLRDLRLGDVDVGGCKQLQALPALPDTLSGLYVNGCRKLQEVSSISHLTKLEALDLSGCTSLTGLPSLDFMHSLRDLRLGDRKGGCEELQALPALPDTLRGLYVKGCRKLQEVSSISHLTKLEDLDLSGCTSLTGLPSLDFMHSLRHLLLGDHRGGCEELQALPALPDTLSGLYVRGCRKLQEVSSISHLTKLEDLDLSWCTSLTGLPSLDFMHSLRELRLGDHKGGCEELQALPALPDTLSGLYVNGYRKLQEVSSISHLTKLEALDLSGCTSLTGLPSLDFMHSLRYLKLQGYEELQALPALPDTLSGLYVNRCRKLQEVSSISHLTQLEDLDLSGCTSLTGLPSLDFMHSLRELRLGDHKGGCEELQALPALPDTLSGLYVNGCRKLQEVSSISHLTKLEALDLSGCTSLTGLPSLDFMHSLTLLQLQGYEELQALPALPDTLSNLYVNGCRKLQEVSSISHLTKLEELDLSGCTSLTGLPSLDFMHSLRDLRLGDRKGGCEELQALPALPDTLSGLYVNGCRKLQEVSSISHLTQLEALDLSGCTSLTGLPSLDFMHSLRDLRLGDRKGGCEELQALPALPDTLSGLYVNGCRKLQEVSSISHLTQLEALDLSGCTSLTGLPSLDFMHSLRDLRLGDRKGGCEELQALPALPDTLSGLYVNGCRKLQEVSSISHLTKLKALDLSGCTSLTGLPSLDFMHSLRDLRLGDHKGGCEELQALPALPDTLSGLYVNGCRKLQEVSSISHLTKLEALDLYGCTSLTGLPSLDFMHSLRHLRLGDHKGGCEELQALPALPDTLSGLFVNGCRKLQEVSSISHLTKLKALDLSGCTSLTGLPSLDFMHSLIDLRLGDHRGGCEELQALPALPDTLSGLYVNGCRKLQEVSSISHLTKLKALDLSGCTSLTGLPSLDFMHSLRYLRLGDVDVGGCEELQALPALPDTLSRLYVNGCRKLQEVSSISHLTKLEALDLSGCTSLTELPSLDSMHSLRGLRLGDVDVGGCEELQALPPLPDTLSCLYLNGCRKLQEVSSISDLKKLEALDLSGCTSLTELPSLDLMHSLRDLEL